jgi:hypothetical protein
MRARTGWGIGTAAVGVACLAIAAILAWVVAPGVKQLPSDTDTVRNYNGTAKLVLNPQAIAGGQFAQAIATNVPVTAQRTVKALNTSGDAAQVSDQQALFTAGKQVTGTSHTWAVDRQSLEATTNIPSDWKVTPHQGLTFNWPIGAQQQDYTGWVSDTQTTTPLKYLRQETKDGVNTYVYEANVAEAPIKDPNVLAALPKELPAAALSGLASSLPLPDQVKSALAQALPSLPNPVPLKYTYESKSIYWVEPTTGIVVDTNIEQVRKAGIPGPGGTVLGALPVFDVTTAFTSTTVQDAANDASNKTNQINAVSSTVPWILTGVGIVAVLVGVALIITGRRRPTTPGADGMPAAGGMPS